MNADKSVKATTKINAAAIVILQQEIGTLKERIVELENGKNERRAERRRKASSSHSCHSAKYS